MISCGWRGRGVTWQGTRRPFDSAGCPLCSLRFTRLLIRKSLFRQLMKINIATFEKGNIAHTPLKAIGAPCRTVVHLARGGKVFKVFKDNPDVKHKSALVGGL